LAFPDQPQLQQRILRQQPYELGRFLIDALRASTLDREWYQKHVSVREIGASTTVPDPQRGHLLVCGHLGSFELMAHAYAHLRRPALVIMRDFKSPLLHAWWARKRQSSGHEYISRDGALRPVLRALRRARAVGILFDQNVRRENAIFVDWFGRPAATTGATALAALSSNCSVQLMSIRNLPHSKYELVLEECSVDDLCNDPALTKDQKVQQITQRLSDRFQAHIREFPEGWFWLHRRWKTAPTREQETFYAGC
jgi:KDO2-lipid IV(A) lauroyltransferase